MLVEKGLSMMFTQNNNKTHGHMGTDVEPSLTCWRYASDQLKLINTRLSLITSPCAGSQLSLQSDLHRGEELLCSLIF